jgi:hypothetical protein
MLAKDRDERFATAAEVAAEVVEVERELNDETLSAPASALPVMEATRALPRPGSGGQADVIPATGPRTVLPPPLPPLPASSLQAPRSTAGALPASPPPPPPPAQTTARTVPRQPRQGHGLAVVVGIAAMVFLLLAASAVWFLVFREKGTEANVAQNETAPSTASVTPDSGPSTQLGGPAQPSQQEVPAEKPAAPPPSSQSPTTQLPRETPAREERAPVTPPVQPAPQDRRPQVAPPLPSTPDVRRPPVDVAPAPAPNIPDEPAPAPADREPERPRSTADRDVQSGLNLEFRVVPPDARVLVDGTVIGTALEWSGGKRNRTYTLPGAGEYEIKIRGQGLREVKLLVEASETGGVTPIYANLKGLAAANADASDLRTIRVREAVAFRVEPQVAAMILVDGQPAGPAREYAGRPLTPRSWLRLPAGRHRVSVVARGYQRQDILVEVTPGAEKERDHIAVTLSSGGDE